MRCATRLLAGSLLMSLLFLGACSKPASNKDAVQQGLMEYLKTRAGISIDTMDVTVTSVTFRGDEADATVSFAAKGSKDHSGAMNMNYVLENKGGKWVVKGRSGTSQHGGDPSGMPPSGMPKDMPKQIPQMPPGHPPTDPGAKK
jgi:hypothetical protein